MYTSIQPKQRCIEESEQRRRWFEELSSGDESSICESDEGEFDATERSDQETRFKLKVSDQEIELDNSSEYPTSNFYLGKGKVALMALRYQKLVSHVNDIPIIVKRAEDGNLHITDKEST
nr:unnamed protein product [Callosobruchus analis]